jgi:aminopeptidase N
LNKYRKDGCGLHTFDDAQDNTQYIYTQFEADYSHYVFPTFEQPDLKAKLTLTTSVPNDWTVVANEDPEDSASERREKG